MIRLASFADLVESIMSGPARLGTVRCVAVDGPAGAGKTTFAGHLAQHLRATGVNVAELHVDDLLDGWADLEGYWSRLADGVLEPLARGEPGRYHRYDWAREAFDPRPTLVDVPDVLIVEGVGSGRTAASALVSLVIFMAASPETRLRRGLHRDGEALRPQWLRWMELEARHFAVEHTTARADLIVDGDSRVVHDRRHQYVILDGGAGAPPPASPLASDSMSLTESQVRDAVIAQLPGVRADLENLVRIPSIAFDGFDHSEVDRSAEAVAELLRSAGLPEVTIERRGGQPAVIGRRPAPPGAPTVLLYAHHDVQPVGDPAAWDSDPFEAVERDGRLYGRGVADDKAGVLAHVAALRALGDDLPVGVVVFVEGEEEFGSDSLGDLLEAHRDRLRADVIVIADSGNWDVGQPALTTSLRGIVNCFVEVRTASFAVHSGAFGGAVPDAITSLCRMIASLHDVDGNVAVEGLVNGSASRLDYPPDRLRAEAGLLDGVQLIGTAPLVDRLWTRPAIGVLGFDAPATLGAPNAVVPVAKAKLSIRIAPGDDPKTAFLALQAHLEKHTPWGVRTTLTLEHDGRPCVIASSGPVYDVARQAFAAAWDGVGPVETGVGGSIPFIATFQEMFPDAEILVTGVADPFTQAHGPNESMDVKEFERMCVAEALLLTLVGQSAATGI
jgi:acetylornithine deacetylase/succinyl-diaminopimelate desuccinylase-like protein/uridine kinase